MSERKRERIVFEGETEPSSVPGYLRLYIDGAAEYGEVALKNIVSREPVPDPEPPVGTVVVDWNGDAFRRYHQGWVCADNVAHLYAWADLDAVPIKVVYSPDA